MVGMSFDPVVEYSRPEAERAGTHLVLMLHGYGSNERDLMSMVPSLPTEGFTYAAMRAPQPCGLGFQWFPLGGTPGERIEVDEQGLREAAQGLVAWIEHHRSLYAGVILLGFSQGMAVASSAVRHRPGIARALVGLSGFVPPLPQDFAQDSTLAQASPRLPVFYGRDQQDPVIPEPMVAETLDWLRKHAEVTKVLYAGMGHSVCPQEIGHVGEFLRHVAREAQA